MVDAPLSIAEGLIVKGILFTLTVTPKEDL